MNAVKKIIPTIIAFSVLPVLALGVVFPDPPGQINGINDIFNKILGFIWPLFFGVAVIMLIVAGFLFILAQGDAEKIRMARWSVFWAVIGLAVGVLAFTIPYVVVNWFR